MTGTRERMRHALLVVVGSVLTALTLASCGDQSSAGAAVPGLTRSLDKVDSAVADERYRVARRGLDQLTAQALEARRSGLLSPDQADRILGAAARLEHELPLPLPVPATQPQDDGESSDTEDSGDDHDEDGYEKEDEEEEDD